MSALTPNMPVCSQEAARAAGLDVAPSPAELLAVAESIVSSWGDRAADPDDVVASTADAGAQLARAVPLVLAEVDRLRARLAELERPSTEAERNALRQSFMELSAQAREDHDYEGQFDIECQLRDREEQWKREDEAGTSTS
ncbi:hypothetical protein [Streptomyces sp. NPDC088178]|uniref:hypothetical protein n=1 Tax=Streptomyces sp. NPDC088178 TaxID=3365836 RepID=UPI0038084E35